MRVLEPEGARFIEEALDVIIGQPRMQHFDGCQAFPADVFAEVHVREAASSDQADETIIPKLLSYTINHTRPFEYIEAIVFTVEIDTVVFYSISCGKKSPYGTTFSGNPGTFSTSSVI